MKKRFTEEKIVRILKEGEGSGKISDVCRKYGISDATFYIWRKKYQGMGGDDVRKLKNLEDENRRLKNDHRTWTPTFPALMRNVDVPKLAFRLLFKIGSLELFALTPRILVL